jgi:hypothetical protein
MRCILRNALVILIGLTGASKASTVCDNPALIMQPNSAVLLLHQIFNSSPASERVFSEVHYIVPGDPHLTVGMGHWVHHKLAGLFKRLRQNEEAWHQLTESWASTLNSAQWADFSNDTGETQRNADAISRGLVRVLCAEDASKSCVKNRLDRWSNRVGTRFNSANHWFHAGWRAASVQRPVAEEQVRYWADGVLAPGQSEARKREIETFGGIASVISAISSGIRATMFPKSASTATASYKGTHFSWPLDFVPQAARPVQSSLNDAALSEDWRSLAAWQFYTVKKRRIRTRMREIWRIFYEPSWGPLPTKVVDVKKIPRHTGCYMARGEFDFASLIHVPTDLDCSAKVPPPKPMECTTEP